MKVISKIIQRIELPDIFIKKYLQHLMDNYKNEKKKESKTRLARLTAFFISNLIEHEHLGKNIIPEEVNEIFKDKIKDDDITKLKKILNKD